MINKQSIPQRHQLELKMEYPLWDDQQVKNESDLQNIKYLYFGKLVWVLDEQCWFFYKKTDVSTTPTGDSIKTLIWERQNNRTKIESYSTGKNYIKGETIWCKQKLYVAKTDITQYPSPPNNPIIPFNDIEQKHWQLIIGNTETIKYEFDETDSFIIKSEIQNPIINCYIKNTETQEFELSDCSIKIIDDTITISFWKFNKELEIDELVKKSGYIIIK